MAGFFTIPYTERYRSGHNGADSKCVGQCGSYVAENLDFMQFLLTLEFE
jgi:hypothetical protein